MNRRRFLLGSAAILAAPSIVPQAVADTVAAWRGGLPAYGPASILPGAINYLSRFEAVIDEALGDLVLFGRCAVHVGPDGVCLLDPMTDASRDVLAFTVPSIPLATQREQFEAAYPYGGWWPEITRMEAEKPAPPAFPARPAPRPVA